MSDDVKDHASWKPWAIAIFTFVLCSFSIYLGFLLYLTWPINEVSINRSGVFGDSFGALTSLFSGLAFGGLVVAILIQREELKTQQSELKRSTKALEMQKTELALTRNVMQNQNFEATFFQMLKLHHDIVDAMEAAIPNIRGEVRGQIFIHNLYERVLRSEFHQTAPRGTSSSPEINLDQEMVRIQQGIDGLMHNYQAVISHYFRYLYRVLKFVDESRIDEKLRYSGIVRALLSDSELALVFYNCQTKNGLVKYKPLAEKFHLFDNLPLNKLFKEEHVDLFDSSAFGDNPDYQEFKSRQFKA